MLKKEKGRSLFFFLAGLAVIALIFYLPAAGQERLTAKKNSLRTSSLLFLPRTTLLAVGDSLTQGTRDATNNQYHLQNASLQRVANKLSLVLPLKFNQAWLDVNGNRLNPLTVPSNLGVDGEDIFSVEGYEYYKRAGSSSNYISSDYLCDRLQPYLFTDLHDKVLYPINILAGKPVSQIDALIWHLNNRTGPAIVIFWVGNNDAALSTLGLGGKNPQYFPIPFDQIKDKLKPLVSYLLNYGKNQGAIAFNPYTAANIEHNLTDTSDFANQLNRLVTRINLNRSGVHYFFLTYPYYQEVGYLMGNGDLEYYLGKLGYSIPESFNGRVSLLTFFCLYALAKEGEVGRIPVILGNDGLVMSSDESATKKSRIDSFNAIISSVNGRPNVHLVPAGEKLNRAFSTGLEVNGHLLTRNWGRGGSFSLDGVHPGHTVHAHIANILLEEINKALGLNAPLWDLASVLATDPYFDFDGDGWVAGPNLPASGRTKILYLFKDYQEGSPGSAVIDLMTPADVWSLISDALLEEILGISLIRAEAERIGAVPLKK
ncbi:MAG: SGNH/GDSL hydrolase family protein [Candidatus Saccharicenans sp.]|uniref:SGNH/GDSL hydrolase family protein n=1 Tax=Candidatus Saccharicenans sp. TaxID=2819258 RepID=UPI00404AFB86